MPKHPRVLRSTGEGVGEQENQSHHQAVDGERFHECQGEQQGAADLAFGFGLTGDALNSAAGCGALTDTGADGGETDSQTSGHNGSSGGNGIHVERGYGGRCGSADGRWGGVSQNPFAPGTSPHGREGPGLLPDLRAMCLADRRVKAKERDRKSTPPDN